MPKTEYVDNSLYLCKNMKRTFHRRPDAEHIAMIVVLAALALFLFLQRRTSAVLLALVFVAEAVIAIERLIHTAYIIDEEAGLLIIDGGRFVRKVRIYLSDIESITDVSRRLLRPAHVLIRYGAGHERAVMPEDSFRFCAFLICSVNRHSGERYDGRCVY